MDVILNKYFWTMSDWFWVSPSSIMLYVPNDTKREGFRIQVRGVHRKLIQGQKIEMTKYDTFEFF